MSPEAIRVVLLDIHASAGTVALVAGTLVLLGRSAGRWHVLTLIVMTVIAFWRVRPLAGALMLPYLAWVGYAMALTFSLVARNPDLL